MASFSTWLPEHRPVLRGIVGAPEAPTPDRHHETSGSCLFTAHHRGQERPFHAKPAGALQPPGAGLWFDGLHQDKPGRRAGSNLNLTFSLAAEARSSSLPPQVAVTQ